MTISKDALLEAIQELPPSTWEELWILVDYLKYKSLHQVVGASQHSNPEGAFPELDLSYEAVEAALHKTWQRRQGRLPS